MASALKGKGNSGPNIKMGEDLPKGNFYLRWRNTVRGTIWNLRMPALKPCTGNDFGSKVVAILEKTIKVTENPMRAQERKARVPRAKVSGNKLRTTP